jgi:tRNA dimethylallyltransferase
MPKPDKTLIVVVGPTAVGKTDLAIKLAQHYHTEIVSADSRQFFREMEIGTAKPSKQELKAAPHHFIDSHNISSEFSVGDFEQQALTVINDLFVNHNTAILVGGSGLYIQAVCQGFDNIPKPSEGTREKFNALYIEEGIEALQRALMDVDPLYYKEVDIQNPQRMIRALEVFETAGKPFSSYRINSLNERPFNILKIGLDLERQELYRRINTRVDQMMKNGLLKEVQNLLPYRHLNALNTVGYSELFDHLEGKLTLEEAIDKIKQNTRRFAKRQLTWFRRQPDIQWFQRGQTEQVLSWITGQLPHDQRPGE